MLRARRARRGEKKESEMRIVPSKALRLCTASEAKLVLESTPKNIGAYTQAGLKSRVERARKVRDKYRSLARQQSGEVKGKRAPKNTRRAEDNANTVYKAELFDQALQNYEARQQKLADEADRQRKLAEARAAKKKAVSSKKRAQKGKAAKGAKSAGERRAKKKAQRAKATGRKASSFDDKKVQASQRKRAAATTARGRRSQARRDSRR
jgi:hypothetical protein